MKKQTLLGSHYHNYTIGNDLFQTIDETYDISQFYDDFIKIRKPVKLINQHQFITLKDFDVDHLQQTLDYHGDLQIETKIGGGFGSNGKRLKMTLQKLMDEFKSGKDEYYLTTQYDEGEDEEEEEDEEEDEETQENIATGIDVFANNVDIHDNEDNVDDFDAKDFNHNHDSEDDSFDFDNLQDDYVDDDENDEEDENASFTIDGVTISKHEVIQRVNELLQPPLTNLATSSFPIIPPIFDKLIPQQINLWMGCISNNTPPPNYTLDLQDSKTLGLGKYIPGDKPGTSSGLHHDHADNLYVLVQGRKRFTIYSPIDGGKLSTIGKIYKIFNSGIIDYQIDEHAPKWKHIRDDGAIIEEIVYWLIDQEKNGHNNQDIIKTYLQQIDEELKSRAKYHNVKALDPPNFSQIPPALLHIDDFTNESDKSSIIQFANTYFPDFLQLKNYKIWLQPGEMLYLPAGWFHEVSSFGNGAEDQLQNVHIALNYWFIPPNDDTKVYSDDYWQQDWQKTKASLKLIRTGQVKPC